MIAADVGLRRDHEGRQPDARSQAECADPPGQPFHTVRITGVALPIAEASLVAVVDLHPLDAVRLEMPGDKLGVLELLVFRRLSKSVEPRAPAVDDRIEPDLVHPAAGVGVTFQRVERSVGQQEHDTTRADAPAGPKREGPVVKRSGGEVHRRVARGPIANEIPAGHDLPFGLAIVQVADDHRATVLAAKGGSPPTGEIAMPVGPGIQ